MYAQSVAREGASCAGRYAEDWETCDSTVLGWGGRVGSMWWCWNTPDTSVLALG